MRLCDANSTLWSHHEAGSEARGTLHCALLSSQCTCKARARHADQASA